MSDTNQEQVTPPTDATDADGSDEWGFDSSRDPLHKDEAQAEASQYGIYGYQDEAGESYIKGEPSDPTSPAPDPKEAPGTEGDATIQRAPGGQGWTQSEYGGSVDQPMQEPQRSASRSPLPDDK